MCTNYTTKKRGHWGLHVRQGGGCLQCKHEDENYSHLQKFQKVYVCYFIYVYGVDGDYYKYNPCRYKGRGSCKLRLGGVPCVDAV